MAEDQAALPSEGKLDLDDDTLRAIAEVYLEDGNNEYKKKEAYNAIYFYTEGLQVNCKDDNLNAKLYSNRATAHFRLGNYQKTLNDATAAIELEPTFVKPVEKGASACVQLQRYKEAMVWCEVGLAVHNNNETLLDLWTKCLCEQNTTQDAKQQETKSMPDTHNLKYKKIKEALSYGNVGKAYFHLGDFQTAIEVYERHLKITREVGDKLEEGATYSDIGHAYYLLGDFKTAIDYNKRLLDIAKELGDKALEQGAYGNLGNAYSNLGDFKRAIDYHKLRLKIAKEVGDKAREGTAYGHLGNNHSKLGNFKTAIDYYERQLKATKEIGDKAGEGTAYGNLGIAYCDLGNIKTAIDYLERHLKIAKEVGDKAGEGRAYGNLGSAYNSLGNSKTAIDYYRKHLKTTKELGDKVGEGKAYGNLGIAYGSLGDFKTSIDYFERDLEFAKEVGDKAGEGHSHCNLGNVYCNLGDFTTAITYYERGLNIANEVGDKAGVARSLHGLGTSLESQGSLPRALDCFHSSVEMFNDIRHHLLFKDEWKISYRDKCKAAYTSLWRLLTTQGKVVEALFAADQGRAQALNDLMELNYGFDVASFSSHAPHKGTYDLLRFLPSNTVFIAIDEREIVFWVIKEGNDVEVGRKEIVDNSSRDLDKFFQSLNVTASEEIGARAAAKCENRSLDKLKNEVVNDRSPGTRPNPIPPHTTALRTFYDVIIGPIADLVDGNELVLVPDGPLCLAPYAAFVDPDSRFLCESFRLRVIPSLTSLKLIVDCPDGYHNKRGVLLVGDPWVQEVVYQGEMLEQLPCAKEEVKMIGKILNTAPLIGREATKDEVLKRISSAALVHIAAHGRMETGEIALTPNTTRASQTPRKEDFLLTMRDVMSVQIRARLVVLSCCHSARGEIKAEGVVGIARAFLAAGARSVLVSLWAIDDEATLEFMKSFYSHLVTGRSASESLNLAMKCMRESDRFSEVKYWAPFVLIGDDVTLTFDGGV